MPTATLDRYELDTGGPLNFLNGRSSAAEQLDAIVAVPSPNRERDRSGTAGEELGSTQWTQKTAVAGPRQAEVLPTTVAWGGPKEVPPLIRLSRPRVAPRRLVVLQQWEGAVTEIDDGVLWAELRDLTKPSNPAEEAELSLESFSVADRKLLRVGSVFYWVIGYQTSPGGQITNISEVRLRRTPQWSQHTIDSIRAKAAELFRELTDDDQS